MSSSVLGKRAKGASARSKDGESSAKAARTGKTVARGPTVVPADSTVINFSRFHPSDEFDDTVDRISKKLALRGRIDALMSASSIVEPGPRYVVKTAPLMERVRAVMCDKEARGKFAADAKECDDAAPAQLLHKCFDRMVFGGYNHRVRALMLDWLEANALPIDDAACLESTNDVTPTRILTSASGTVQLLYGEIEDDLYYDKRDLEHEELDGDEDEKASSEDDGDDDDDVDEEEDYAKVAAVMFGKPGPESTSKPKKNGKQASLDLTKGASDIEESEPMPVPPADMDGSQIPEEHWEREARETESQQAE